MGVYADLHNSNTSAVIVGQMTSPVSSGLFLYTDNTLTVMNLSGTEQNQKVNHFGKITGNLSVNNHNIYTEYGNYIVNDYNYWLFANYVKNYDVIANGPSDYGIFTGIYNTVFSRFDYYSEEVIPNGLAEVTDFVADWRVRFNSMFEPFISSTGQTPFWIFSIVLALVAVFLTFRIIIFFIQW